MTLIHSQVKVLIAERTLSMAELIARSLRMQGYTIAGIVNSAEKAIEFATLKVPDIVLLDLPLHGELDAFMAGWKILREVRCPVVYMTTQPGDMLHQRQLLNCYGFLLKPFTVEELKATIDQTIEQYWVEQSRDRSLSPNAAETDAPFLVLLALASAMTPMPRILFVGDRLNIYTINLETAKSLRDYCQKCAFPFAYQIFAWRWETGQYQRYAQKS
ncbi:MAG: response regulator [Leptolyngbyaceae cyanobacterium bins.302]|nr:response regulator [Leptolyngbyaceae cyanobacterium bins.302]